MISSAELNFRVLHSDQPGVLLADIDINYVCTLNTICLPRNASTYFYRNSITSIAPNKNPRISLKIQIGATNITIWNQMETGNNCHWSMELPEKKLWWKSNFKQICFKLFMKGGHSFRRFNCNRELIIIECIGYYMLYNIWNISTPIYTVISR